MNNACKSLNFIIKMRALLRKFIARFFHFMLTEAAIRAIVTKFRTKFTLLDIKPPTRLHRVRTEKNIAAVSASVNDRFVAVRSNC